MDKKNVSMGKKWLEWCEGFLGMLMVQIFATGLQLLSKVILSEGTFIFALLAYRYVVAALCVAPFAFFFERGNSKKLISWSVWFWLFINAFTGMISAMGLYYYGLRDTTATYAVNFNNLIPIVTFVFSIILRLDKLRMNSRQGKLKILGAILCAGGALTASIYKGKSFHMIHHATLHPRTTLVAKVTKQHNWTRGSFFLVGSCMLYATWFILQVKMLKIFPFKYWATTLTCIIASVQATVLGLCLDRRTAAWRLGWDLQLVTIIYSGALSTAATFCLLSWAIAKRGPTYPTMFNPLSLILVAMLEALILGQDIRLGTLLGSVIIIVGLYSFLWAKTNEFKLTAKPNPIAPEELGEAVAESVRPQSNSKASLIPIPITTTATTSSADNLIVIVDIGDSTSTTVKP